MTLFESLNAFYKSWWDSKPSGIPSDTYWQFSEAGWRAYKIGEKKEGLDQGEDLNPDKASFLLRFPVKIIDGDQYWYELVVQGEPVVMPEKFPFYRR